MHTAVALVRSAAGAAILALGLAQPAIWLIAQPLALHPDNPRYFLFRGQPTVLITSGEHYGAVLNLDFDFTRYLAELEKHGFNQTRAFSGFYREYPGQFGISGNTLAPAPGRFVCPWARSDTPGAADGWNKFDLDRWDPVYFERLKRFLAEAGRRGVVVELVLFCTMYDDKVWSLSPLAATNNLQGVGAVSRSAVFALQDQALTARQEAMVRRLVAELNAFDNLYYEICNEPYERGGFSRAWHDRMVAAILETEAALPKQHLIAEGVAVRATRITQPNPHISIFNFHAATPESVTLNYDLNRPIADDETGGKGRADFPYRSEAWEFMLAGGAVFSHLDFSFTCAHPDGTAPITQAPGGGGPALRRQLSVLKRFLEGFDFLKLRPETNWTVRHEASGAGSGSRRPSAPSVRVLATPGRAYAIYLQGGRQSELTLDLPAGPYRADWVDTGTGALSQTEDFAHAGGPKTLRSPLYPEDIALRLNRIGPPE